MEQMKTSCVYCDMGNHGQCVAVKLGEKWLLKPEQHCWCLSTGHKDREGMREYTID